MALIYSGANNRVKQCKKVFHIGHGSYGFDWTCLRGCIECQSDSAPASAAHSQKPDSCTQHGGQPDLSPQRVKQVTRTHGCTHIHTHIHTALHLLAIWGVLGGPHRERKSCLRPLAPDRVARQCHDLSRWWGDCWMEKQVTQSKTLVGRWGDCWMVSSHLYKVNRSKLVVTYVK
eukprot:1162016-Pelagomonas_calceolata.AAC.24